MLFDFLYRASQGYHGEGSKEETTMVCYVIDYIKLNKQTRGPSLPRIPTSMIGTVHEWPKNNSGVCFQHASPVGKVKIQTCSYKYAALVAS